MTLSMNTGDAIRLSVLLGRAKLEVPSLYPWRDNLLKSIESQIEKELRKVETANRRHPVEGGFCMKCGQEIASLETCYETPAGIYCSACHGDELRREKAKWQKV